MHFASSWPDNSLFHGFLLGRETSGDFLVLEGPVVTLKPFLIKLPEAWGKDKIIVPILQMGRLKFREGPSIWLFFLLIY